MSEISVQDLVNVDGTDKKEATKLGIRLMTSKDRMRLYVVVIKEIPDLGVLRKFISDASIKSPLDFDKFTDPEIIEKINKGRYPVLVSDLSHILKPVPSVDFVCEKETLEYLWRKLVFLEPDQNPPKLKKISVKPGTVLANIHDYETMKKELAYEDVFGRAYSGENRISKIEFGEGVEINEETHQAIAQKDGFVDFRDFTLSVVNTITIEDPQAVEDELLDFIGNIEINTPFAAEGEDELEYSNFGNFAVKAGESIRITGDWGNKNLWAGGDIAIEHEINGDLDTTLKAGGKITALFVNRVNAASDSDCIIENGLYYSTIKSFGHLKVLEGPIVGGKYFGAAGVEAEELGNSEYEETVIMAGCVYSVIGELSSIKNEMIGIQKRLIEAQKVIKPYLERMDKDSSMTDEEKTGVRELLRNMKLMKNRYLQLKGMLDSRESPEIKAAKVKISGDVFPGVQIIINNAEYSVAEKLNNVIFSFDNEANKIKIEKFS